MSLSTDIAKFTDLVQNWATNVSDTFYSNVAKDVTIKVINESGDVVEVSIPNHAKMSEAFVAWQDAVNVTNDNGVLKDNNGGSVSTDLFGGMTLSEYVDAYGALDNTNTVKLMPVQHNNSMTPYQLFAVVSKANTVKFWGYNPGSVFNYSGTNAQSMLELNTPAEKAGVEISKLYVSGYHIAILFEDGDLYGRGYQAEGHFGIGNTSNQYKFVFMTDNVTDYVTSSYGDQDEQPSARVIKIDGSVWSAGDNGHGELGNGTVTNSYVWNLVYEPANNNNDKCVSLHQMGDDMAYSFLLTESGKVFRTGYNGYGQLGTGDTTQLTSYTQIDTATFDAPVAKIVLAGGYTDAIYTGTTYVITTTGRVYATGNNNNYQLGNGTTTNSNTFNEIAYETEHNVATDPVVNVFHNWHALYVLTESDTLYGLGNNNYGHLGIGNTTSQTTMVKIADNVKNYYRVIGSDAADYPSSYIVKKDGTLWACGYNGYGTLGLNHTSQVNTFTKVDFGDADKIKSIGRCGYSNQNTTYIELNDGRLYAAGYNGYSNATGQTADAACIAQFSKIML